MLNYLHVDVDFILWTGVRTTLYVYPQYDTKQNLMLGQKVLFKNIRIQ